MFEHVQNLITSHLYSTKIWYSFMSEGTDFIIQHLNAIFGGAEGDENLTLVSELHEFCSTLDSYGFLIEILNSQQEESIKNQCVLLVHRLFLIIPPEELHGNNET